jgi:hypothetical protein
MGMFVISSEWVAVTVADVLGLIPVLAPTYGIIFGAVALMNGWQLFSDSRQHRRRPRIVVPPVGAIERNHEGGPR